MLPLTCQLSCFCPKPIHCRLRRHAHRAPTVCSLKLSCVWHKTEKHLWKLQAPISLPYCNATSMELIRLSENKIMFKKLLQWYYESSYFFFFFEALTDFKTKKGSNVSILNTNITIFLLGSLCYPQSDRSEWLKSEIVVGKKKENR